MYAIPKDTHRSHFFFCKLRGINYDFVEERNERVGGIYAPHAPRIVLPRGYGR